MVLVSSRYRYPARQAGRQGTLRPREAHVDVQALCSEFRCAQTGTRLLPVLRCQSCAILLTDHALHVRHYGGQRQCRGSQPCRGRHGGGPYCTARMHGWLAACTCHACHAACMNQRTAAPLRVAACLVCRRDQPPRHLLHGSCVAWCQWCSRNSGHGRMAQDTGWASPPIPPCCMHHAGDEPRAQARGRRQHFRGDRAGTAAGGVVTAVAGSSASAPSMTRASSWLSKNLALLEF